MVFNATLNNISVISWRQDLLMEETEENHQPDVSHWQTLSHNVMSNTPRLSGIRTHNLVLVGTVADFIGSYKSNYHTSTTAPKI